MTRQKQIGKHGEDLARRFLENKGHQILACNWRHRRAEIDLISRQQEVVIFTEVKTRSTNHFGEPEEAVSAHKEAMLVDAAGAYMEEIGHEWGVRFDIISVILHPDGNATIRHFEDAFFPGE